MKPFKKFIAVVGADRVGKSTFIEKIAESYRQANPENYHLFKAHFSGPKPHHHSPTDQYYDVLKPVATQSPPPGLVICDRFGSEVCFYEKFRRNYEISQEWAQAFESWVLGHSKQFALVYITKRWEDIEHRHVEEIQHEIPNATTYYTNMLLRAREEEHNEYQSFMDRYLEFLTLIPPNQIFISDGSDFPTLDMVSKTGNAKLYEVIHSEV